jgi:hypothetical protein
MGWIELVAAIEAARSAHPAAGDGDGSAAQLKTLGSIPGAKTSEQ